MPTQPESWSSHLSDEFDRLIENMLTERGTRELRSSARRLISAEELETIRKEILAIATTDHTSLAYQVLLRSGTRAHMTDPCPTCDAAIRLAWGASKARRALGLPAVDSVAHVAVAGADHSTAWRR